MLARVCWPVVVTDMKSVYTFAAETDQYGLQALSSILSHDIDGLRLLDTSVSLPRPLTTRRRATGAWREETCVDVCGSYQIVDEVRLRHAYAPLGRVDAPLTAVVCDAVLAHVYDSPACLSVDDWYLLTPERVSIVTPTLPEYAERGDFTTALGTGTRGVGAP